jgi:hypothetical protein
MPVLEPLRERQAKTDDPDPVRLTGRGHWSQNSQRTISISGSGLAGL